MLIGIIANITKENVFSVVSSFIKELKRNNLEFLLTKTLMEDKDNIIIEIDEDFISDDKEIYETAPTGIRSIREIVIISINLSLSFFL